LYGSLLRQHYFVLKSLAVLKYPSTIVVTGSENTLLLRLLFVKNGSDVETGISIG